MPWANPYAHGLDEGLRNGSADRWPLERIERGDREAKSRKGKHFGAGSRCALVSSPIRVPGGVSKKDAETRRWELRSRGVGE